MAVTDITGYQTLKTIQSADRFNRWMYETIRPYLAGTILEIGSGIGNISTFLLQNDYSLTLSDTNNHYLSVLKKQFGQYKNAKGFEHIVLAEPDFEQTYSRLKETFDTVFLLNVLEHINDHKTAISNCRYLLKEGGTLIVLVPAYKQLYSRFDRLLGHHRRYTASSLKSLITENRFGVIKSLYFNILGIAGWLWNKVFNKSEIGSGKMSLFNYLIPMAKFLDSITLHKAGLSVIVIAKKV